jgi:hypothetical protein
MNISHRLIPSRGKGKWTSMLIRFFLSKISDWLNLNRDMLKQQSIPVGDVDTIQNHIDRQKVSWRFCGDRMDGCVGREIVGVNLHVSWFVFGSFWISLVLMSASSTETFESKFQIFLCQSSDIHSPPRLTANEDSFSNFPINFNLF